MHCRLWPGQLLLDGASKDSNILQSMDGEGTIILHGIERAIPEVVEFVKQHQLLAAEQREQGRVVPRLILI